MSFSSLFGFLFSFLLLVSLSNGHTMKICYDVQGTDVTFYAGSWHSSTEQGNIGGVVLSNGPSGNGRYDFTSFVEDDNELPLGIDTSAFGCTVCQTGNTVGYWQSVTVSGLSEGDYDVTTTADTVVEQPYCDFPSLTIEGICFGECESDVSCNKCQEYFGYECLSCENGFGCTECDYEYELVFDSECQEYGCEPELCGPAPTVCEISDVIDSSSNCILPCEDYPCKCNKDCQFCDVCHENGCNQCDSGYFKKGYNYPCVQCQEYFGDGCLFCQDFDGCGQCGSGYQRVYNSYCGLWECE